MRTLWQRLRRLWREPRIRLPGPGLRPQDLRPGDRLTLTGSFGQPFEVPADRKANLVMIGLGTGIAPFRGLVMAPASKVTINSDRPAYTDVELDRPELYFSPVIEGYAIVGTEENESLCGDNADYEGTAGVDMGGFFSG